MSSARNPELIIIGAGQAAVPLATRLAAAGKRVTIFERGTAGSQRLVPYTVFTDPQLKGVGLSEQTARERGFEVEVASLPFRNVARAIETDETAGVIQVVLDAKTERILGAFIVGVDAGELIHVFSTLMNSGASARTLGDAQFVHPTFAEGLQTAVLKFPRYALS
jgi:pyruvate/2-oxoglutarate dehydrogenase complex dihydrolipoamide dehydrogenase (E3) component